MRATSDVLGAALRRGAAALTLLLCLGCATTRAGEGNGPEAARSAGADGASGSSSEVSGGSSSDAWKDEVRASWGPSEADSLPERAPAQHALADALRAGGLEVAAASVRAAIVREGPDHPFYRESIVELTELQESLDDPFLIPTALGAAFRDDWAQLPEEARHRAYYLVGLVRQREGRYEEAVALLEAVPEGGPLGAKARYLLGVILSDPRFPGGARLERARALFEALTKLEPDGDETLERVKGLARLGEGRVLYGQRRYRSAAEAYRQVPRYSDFWDQALFEEGFARFQAEDYGGALGAFQALHAPQFESAFQPESWLVKATVYYFNCLYEEAAVAMKAFAERYLPMADDMERLLAETGEDYDRYFELLIGEPERAARPLPRQVRLWVRNNERVKDLFALMARLADELAVAKRLGGPVGEGVLELLRANRATVVDVTGKLVQNRIAEATRSIRDYTNDGALIRFETTLAEKRLLERGIDQKKIRSDQSIHRPALPSPDHEYWSFQGEFWRDEIGYYRYTLKDACPEGEKERNLERLGGGSAQAR